MEFSTGRKEVPAKAPFSSCTGIAGTSTPACRAMLLPFWCNWAMECVGGAYQRIHEMIEDNQHAERWLATQGFERPIVIGHSNGGMLAVKHCAGSTSVRALVLLSAHMGRKALFRTISEAGLMACKRFD